MQWKTSKKFVILYWKKIPLSLITINIYVTPYSNRIFNNSNTRIELPYFLAYISMTKVFSGIK